MKKLTIITLAALLMAACMSTEEQLKQRAAELCRHIPDHELREESKDYMTADFYAVLDTMFNRLPDHEAMDHEWLYYFVTGNGGTIANYTVTAVELTDDDHAVATISVRQQWEDGSFDENTDVEEHCLYMERVEGQWLMSDFDGHKADCIRHITLSRREEALRGAIIGYLKDQIGPQYLQGELCVPTLMMVHEEEQGDSLMLAWCDCWIYWYNPAGDTLKCISGGNHSGLFTLRRTGGNLTVTSFDQTTDGASFTPSARRIFGPHYDLFCNMHSNADVREAVRREQLRELVQTQKLPFRYYQDYGWPAVKIED